MCFEMLRGFGCHRLDKSLGVHHFGVDVSKSSTENFNLTMGGKDDCSLELSNSSSISSIPLHDANAASAYLTFMQPLPSETGTELAGSATATPRLSRRSFYADPSCFSPNANPKSFHSLPPLEQRRQIAIAVVIKDLRSLSCRFNSIYTDLKLASCDSRFGNEMTSRVAALLTSAKKLAVLLNLMTDRVDEVQIAYEEQADEKGDHPECYVPAIGSWLCPKVKLVLECYEDDAVASVVRKVTPDEKSREDPVLSQSWKDVLSIATDLVVTLEEGISDLLENTVKVVSATPRKHQDFKPLRTTSEELRIAVKDITERHRLERASRIQRARQLCGESGSSKPSSTVKRRISWDNLSMKSLFQVTRSPSLSLGRCSVGSRKSCTPVLDRRPRPALSDSGVAFASTPLFKRASKGKQVHSLVPTFSAPVHGLSKGSVASRRSNAFGSSTLLNFDAFGPCDSSTSDASSSAENRASLEGSLRNDPPAEHQETSSAPRSVLHPFCPMPPSPHAMRARSYNLLRRPPATVHAVQSSSAHAVGGAHPYEAASVLVSAERGHSKSAEVTCGGPLELDCSRTPSKLRQVIVTGLLGAADPQSNHREGLPSVEVQLPRLSQAALKHERRASSLCQLWPVSSPAPECSRSSLSEAVSPPPAVVTPLGSEPMVGNETGNGTGTFGALHQLEANGSGALFRYPTERPEPKSCFSKCDPSGVCLPVLDEKSRAKGEIDRGGTEICAWGSICAAGMVGEKHCCCRSHGESPDATQIDPGRYDIYARKKSAPTILTGRSTFFADSMTRNTSCDDDGQLLNSTTLPLRSRIDAMLTLPTKWWPASKTSEVKPRLGSGADSRRRTFSTLLDASVESDARRLVLKKTKSMPDSVKKWADSFDLLLSDQGGVEVFRIFLRSEYSEENMRFYTACEELKQARSFRVGPRAKRIYKTFIEDHAPMEVNLDFETKKSIRDAMKSPHRTMFDEAQRKIREMLSADAYPRFIRSDFYKKLLNS